MLAHVQRQCAAAAGECCRLTFQSCHLFSIGTGQHGLHLKGSRNWLLVIASDAYLDVQVGISVILVQIGSHIPVEQTGLGRGIEINIVEDACQAPVVLTLEIKAVAVFDDLHGQRVTAFLQILCNIVLGRLLSSLVVAHFLTVDPQKRCRCHLLKTQKDLLSIPVGGNSEGGAVGTCWVVVAWCLGRVGLEWRRHVAE